MARKIKISTSAEKFGVLDLKVQEAKKRTAKLDAASALVKKFDNPVKHGMVWTPSDLSSEFEKRKKIKKDW
jgi:hypothetical protein